MPRGLPFWCRCEQVRYLMTYEQDPEAWETLRTRRILEGTWKQMAVFGEVEPQHGLFACELSFIERAAGFVFPRAVWEFYRLFGRLKKHSHGNSDLITSPYTYAGSSTYEQTHNGKYVVFLVENQAGWMWGYRRGGAQDPEMVLFDGGETPSASARLIDANSGFEGFAHAYEYPTRFSEFVVTWRNPYLDDAEDDFHVGRPNLMDDNFPF